MSKFKFLGADSGRLPRIDRYELIAEIATGGMATVYLGRILGVGGFERFVAIKRLHPHLGADESFVKMFLDEARLVANIRHQHVVPVLEVGAGHDGYYLVMEYVEGETLGALLARSAQMHQRVPAKVAIRIVLDTLAGLHAAHELVDPNGEPVGLVHRDVSPQNILIDVHGVSRIADFGVAHATSRLGSTRAGQLKGKVAYMAPEQARGDLVTRRADVFAAGIVLWETLCMKRLFLAENEAVTLNRLIFEPIPKLRAGNPAMPASLEKVLERALDRNVEGRFESAAEFASALESASRAARMLVDTSDVKAWLAEAIGAQIEERRSAIRAHLAFIDQPRDESVDAHAGSPQARPARPESLSPPPLTTASSAAMTLPSAPAAPEPARAADILSQRGAMDDDEFPPARRKWPIVVALALALVAGGALIAVVASRPSGEGQIGAGPASSLRDLPTATHSAPLAETEQLPAATTSAAVTAATSSGSTAPRPPVRGAPMATGTTRHAPSAAPDVPTAAPPSETTAPVEPATTAPPTAPPADTDDLKKNPYR